MERNPDKKSGFVYHAAERACKRRFEEVEREFRRARQPELPTVGEYLVNGYERLAVVTTFYHIYHRLFTACTTRAGTFHLTHHFVT